MASGGDRASDDDMTARVRHATTADARAVRELLSEVAGLHRLALPHLFRPSAAELEHDEHLFAGQSFAAFLENRDGLLLVAETDDSIAGVLLGRLERSGDTAMLAARRVLHIVSLMVRADEQRAGIGRALMKAAEGWAREAGATEIELHVWELNLEALAFYHALGYETIMRTMRLPLKD